MLLDAEAISSGMEPIADASQAIIGWATNVELARKEPSMMDNSAQRD